MLERLRLARDIARPPRLVCGVGTAALTMLLRATAEYCYGNSLGLKVPIRFYRGDLNAETASEAGRLVRLKLHVPIFYSGDSYSVTCLDTIAEMALGNLCSVSITQAKDCGPELGRAALYMAIVIGGAAGARGLSRHFRLHALVEAEGPGDLGGFYYQSARQQAVLARIASECGSLDELKWRASTLCAEPPGLDVSSLPPVAPLADMILAWAGEACPGIRFPLLDTK